MPFKANFLPLCDKIDSAIAQWMECNGRFFLRISLGIIFIWFGVLKPLGLSPAQALITKTVYWFDPALFIPILGWWEIIIGICLLFRPLVRLGILLLFLQMSGTILPLFILPDVCFKQIPFVLTLEGQYIIKNLILISAAIVVGGTVRNSSEQRRSIRL